MTRVGLGEAIWSTKLPSFNASTFLEGSTSAASGSGFGVDEDDSGSFIKAMKSCS